MGVGGTSSGAAMFISATELSLISGSYDASKYIIFESTQGSINLSSINQGNHLPNAQNPKIKIVTSAEKDITFANNAFYFSDLTVESGAGIVLNEKLATTFGDMSLTYSAGNLVVAVDAELFSAGALTLTTGSS